MAGMSQTQRTIYLINTGTVKTNKTGTAESYNAIPSYKGLQFHMRPVALKSEFIRLAADFWEVNHESLS
jgi:hypothetical protein